MSNYLEWSIYYNLAEEFVKLNHRGISSQQLFYQFYINTIYYVRCIHESLLTELSISLAVVFVASLIIVVARLPTREQRYKKALQGCWGELTTLIEKSSCNPIMLRLAWSDAVNYDSGILEWPYSGGVNGSIRFDMALNIPANAGLSKAIALLTPIKRKYNLVSWADLIQMAAVVSIKLAGGPTIDLAYGREDAAYDVLNVEEEMKAATNTQQLRNVSSIAFKHALCPIYPSAVPPYPDGAPTADVHIRNVFYRMGLNNRETVALCGGHTLGRAFQDRTGVCSFSSGDQGATFYTQPTALAKVCKITGGEWMW